MDNKLFKQIIIWIPIVSFIYVFIDKESWNKPMYYVYFSWGSPFLIILNAIYHAVMTLTLISIFI